MKYSHSIKQNWKGMLVAIVMGVMAVLIKKIVKVPILDPLVVAMIMGILIRSFVILLERTFFFLYKKQITLHVSPFGKRRLRGIF